MVKKAVKKVTKKKPPAKSVVNVDEIRQALKQALDTVVVRSVNALEVEFSLGDCIVEALGLEEWDWAVRGEGGEGVITLLVAEFLPFSNRAVQTTWIDDEFSDYCIHIKVSH